MIFDYSAGGLIPNSDNMAFLLSNKKHSQIANNGKVKAISARWREDKGPIGQALRDGKIDLLRTALNNVKKCREK